MKYVKQCAVNNTAELVRQCLSRLKKLNLDLTEGELVQIANHVPLFPVEIHLVSNFSPARIRTFIFLYILHCLELIASFRQYSLQFTGW